MKLLLNPCPDSDKAAPLLATAVNSIDRLNMTNYRLYDYLHPLFSNPHEPTWMGFFAITRRLAWPDKVVLIFLVYKMRTLSHSAILPKSENRNIINSWNPEVGTHIWETSYEGIIICYVLYVRVDFILLILPHAQVQPPITNVRFCICRCFLCN